MWDLIVSVPDHCLSSYFVLSTQLHEEMYWRFPIADKSPFRTLTFVPPCNFHNF